MELRRRTSRREATDESDFEVGQKVWVVEGFLGTITAIEESPADEQYLIELDDGMGGGTWGMGEIRPAEEVVASLTVEAKVASDDYPMLADILEERLPMPHSEPVGGIQSTLHAAGYVVLNDAEEVVAGPFTSRLDAVDAEKMLREDGETDLYIQREGSKEAGWFMDKVLEPAADRMIARQPEDMRYNEQTGAMPSFDWCRFRVRRRCFFPKTLDSEQSYARGYGVWEPIDRGFCWREKWEDQKSCPAPSEPGPESKESGSFAEIEVQWNGNAVTYEKGMNRVPVRFGSVQPVPVEIRLSANRNQHTVDLVEGEFTWHLTAKWRDVQEKASRIRQDGHVRVISSSPAYLVGEVRGDTNIYQTTLMREGTTDRVAMWECGCAWAAYSWGRSGRWKRFEGRMCSHALALHYEGQSRGWGGQTITEDMEKPSWMSDPTITVKVPGDYKRPEIGEWRLSSRDDEEDSIHLVDLDPALHPAPVEAMVRDMAADGDDPREIASLLQSFGIANAKTVVASITKESGLRDVIVKVRGRVKKLLDILGDKAVTDDGEEVDVREIEHPNWHPTRGLSGGPTASLRKGAPFAGYEDYGLEEWLGNSGKPYAWAVAGLTSIAAILIEQGIAPESATLSPSQKVDLRECSVLSVVEPLTSIPQTSSEDDDSVHRLARWVGFLGNDEASDITDTPESRMSANSVEGSSRTSRARSAGSAPTTVMGGGTQRTVSTSVGQTIPTGREGSAQSGPTSISPMNGSRSEIAFWNAMDIVASTAVSPETINDFMSTIAFHWPKVDPHSMMRTAYLCVEVATEEFTRDASLWKHAPMGPYKDFDACVAANQDKDDPSAYCGSIKHKVEGKLANADSEDGAMIALRPPDEILDQVHIGSGEDYDNLHLTVVYLGKSAEIDQEAVEAAVEEWSAKWGPIPGQLSGYGVFENGTDRVLHASVDAPGLDRARDDLLDTLAAHGVAPEDDHGFDPHMTLAYGNVEAPTEMPAEAKTEFMFPNVYVAYGQTWIEYPLGGVTAARKTASGGWKVQHGILVAILDSETEARAKFDTWVDEARHGWRRESPVLLHRYDRSAMYAQIPGGLPDPATAWVLEDSALYDGSSGEMRTAGKVKTAVHISEVSPENLVIGGIVEMGGNEYRIVATDRKKITFVLDRDPSKGIFTGFTNDDGTYMSQIRWDAPAWQYPEFTAKTGELKDEPEAALPETTGEEEISDFAGDETDVADDPDIGAPAAIVEEDPDQAGEEIEPGDPRLAWLMKGTQDADDLDIAKAAKQHLALKEFTQAEQQALINEGEGVEAANLDRLQLEGTHYELLDAADDEEDDPMWLM